LETFWNEQQNGENKSKIRQAGSKLIPKFMEQLMLLETHRSARSAP